jgi:hypothetical protein
MAAFGWHEDPDEEAARTVKYVKAHREPEYEPGEVYEDADGDRFIRSRTEGIDYPWRSFGGDRFRNHYPTRPLRKLVPEGTQRKVTREQVRKALMWDDKNPNAVDRIMKLLEEK